MFHHEAQEILASVILQYQIEDPELINELTGHAGEFVRINGNPLSRTEEDHNQWEARKVSMSLVDPLSQFMRDFMEEVLDLR